MPNPYICLAQGWISGQRMYTGTVVTNSSVYVLRIWTFVKIIVKTER